MNFQPQKILAALILGSLAFGAFAVVMTAPINHNEHMYIAAASLIGSGQMYTDFSYLQSPTLPVLYHALFEITLVEHLLLLTRVVTWVGFMACGAILYGLAWWWTRDRLMALAATALFLLNELCLWSAAEVSNYIAPMLFALLGTLLYCQAFRESQILRLRLFLAGVMLGLSLGCKILYVPAVFPFLVTSLGWPQRLKLRERCFEIFLPFLIGIVVGAAPLLYHLIRSPEVFLFNNFGYHMENAARSLEHSGASGHLLASRLAYGLQVMSQTTTLTVLILVLTLGGAVMARRGGLALWSPLKQMETSLCLMLTLGMLFTALIPWPLQFQYFAMVVPFALLLACRLCAHLDGDSQMHHRPLVVVLLLLSLLFGGKEMLRFVPKVQSIDNWTGVVAHREALRLRNLLGIMESDDRVATLAPLIPLEARIPIYREFATGPFLFRVGDRLDEDVLHMAHGTSPSRVVDLFRANPPKAILVGFEPGLEDSLVRYAQENGYRLIQERVMGGSLFVRQPDAP